MTQLMLPVPIQPMFMLKPLGGFDGLKLCISGIAARLPLLQPRRSFIYEVGHGLE